MSHRQQTLLAVIAGCFIIYLAIQVTFPANPFINNTSTQSQHHSGYTMEPLDVSPPPVTPINLPSQTCTFTTTIGGKTILYTRGKSVRVQFANKVPSMKMTDILVTANNLYFWDAIEKQGTVTNLTDTGQNNLISLYYNSTIKQLKPEDCEQMDLPNSIFFVPQDVTFSTGQTK